MVDLVLISFHSESIFKGTHSKIHVGPCETSMVQRFWKNSLPVKTGYLFCRKTPLKMFDRVLNTPLTLPNNYQVIYKYQIIYSELAGQHIRYTGWRGASRTLNISHGAFCENSKRLNVLEYFCKKFHLRCLTGFWMQLWSEHGNSRILACILPHWVHKIPYNFIFYANYFC